MNFIITISMATTALAMPSFMNDPVALEKAREILRRDDPLGLSKAESNCGLIPCVTFDEEDQLVKLNGANAYVAPSPGDIRGPCPGLNAAANHGFLPRDGIVSIEETVAGLGALYVSDVSDETRRFRFGIQKSADAPKRTWLRHSLLSWLHTPLQLMATHFRVFGRLADRCLPIFSATLYWELAKDCLTHTIHTKEMPRSVATTHISTTAMRTL